jgi:hypothetical protein
VFSKNNRDTIVRQNAARIPEQSGRATAVFVRGTRELGGKLEGAMIARWLAFTGLGAAIATSIATGNAQGVRLYCDQLGGYYPNVTSCPTGWRRVVPGYVPGVPGTVYAPGVYGPGIYAPGVYGPGVYAPETSPPINHPPASYPPAAAPSGYPTAAPASPPPGVAPHPPAPARENSEEQHVVNLSTAAEIGMRREQDAADGYRETTVANAVKRFKAIGSGLIITGYYSLVDDRAILAEKPGAENRILAVPDKLSKAGRAMLADCDDCRITIWARKGCSKSALGDQPGAPCLMIERVKKETYEANTTIYR